MVVYNSNVLDFCIYEDDSVRKAMSCIDKLQMGSSVIINRGGTLVGTVSDGDIRRGFLNGISIDAAVKEIMNINPVFFNPDFTEVEAETSFIKNHIKLIPVIDVSNRLVVGVLSYNIYKYPPITDHAVVLMVGGEGARLAPLTDEIPKPLLKVGGKPILQIILERLSLYGFQNIFLCTRYRGDAIKEFCGDGTRFGLNINYISEEQKLGTIGAVKYLEGKLHKPFILMNGDLLTLLNYKNILDFHLDNKSDLTVGSKEFKYSVPYGVLHTDGIKINSIVEKPIFSYRINAGIYVLNPSLLEIIPKDKYFDITDLMSKMFEMQARITAFPIEEYWLDIGQHQDYKQANDDFYNFFIQ